MTANIFLDSRHTHYTNLDYLSGKVVLNLPTEAAIGGIQVKLEGESRTRLSGPRNPQNVHSEKKRTELEVHKVREQSALKGVHPSSEANRHRFYIRLRPSSLRPLSCKPDLRRLPTLLLPGLMNTPSISRSVQHVACSLSYRSKFPSSSLSTMLATPATACSPTSTSLGSRSRWPAIPTAM